MGILRLNNDFILDPLWDTVENWIEVECKGTVDTLDEDRYYVILGIEGEDIPEGNEEIYIQITFIVPDVMIIEIKAVGT